MNSTKLAPATLLAAILLARIANAQSAWKPELLPAERERAAALSAGPATIAGGAGIYLLTEKGFVLDRPSRNGFHCLVGRDLPGGFEPQCLDAEGSGTLLQVMLFRATLQMKGESPEAISRAVADGYASGRLRAPGRPGINYMLSRENHVPRDDKGTVVPYRPHVMIYAPYLTNAEFGASADGGSPVFVINEGTPGAYLIIPIPEDTMQPHAGKH